MLDHLLGEVAAEVETEGREKVSCGISRISSEIILKIAKVE